MFPKGLVQAANFRFYDAFTCHVLIISCLPNFEYNFDFGRKRTEYGKKSLITYHLIFKIKINHNYCFILTEESILFQKVGNYENIQHHDTKMQRFVYDLLKWLFSSCFARAVVAKTSAEYLGLCREKMAGFRTPRDYGGKIAM